MGDFTGFSFGDWHNIDPDTGIVAVHRVSGGDRYTEQLQPELKDRTAEIPGLDGNYYFGTDFGPKNIEIDIAFDHLTEKQFRDLRTAFGVTEIKKLIFDECPYKYYMAKLASPIELSYICFDEPIKRIAAPRDGVRKINDRQYTRYVEDPETGEMIPEHYTARGPELVTPYVVDFSKKQRIYKGEGKISLIAYFPFAKSVYKQLPIGEEESDWAISSGILSVDDYSNIDIYDNTTNSFKIYNPGDLETGFRLYCPGITNELQINYIVKNQIVASLIIDEFTTKEGDNGFIIDTNTGLITGVINSTITITHFDRETGEISEIIENNKPIHVDAYGNAYYTTSGNLYNQYVKYGNFFKIKPTTNINEATIEITGITDTPQIFYDYLYF